MTKTRLHAAAGSVALATILSFWGSTAVTLILGDPAVIHVTKTFILAGMGLLIPALISAGVTGNLLARGWKSRIVARKRLRMIVITANGALLLLPSAIFLASRDPGGFDGLYAAVQTVELLAGAVNIALLSLNMRDGLALRRPRRAPIVPAPG